MAKTRRKSDTHYPSRGKCFSRSRYFPSFTNGGFARKPTTALKIYQVRPCLLPFKDAGAGLSSLERMTPMNCPSCNQFLGCERYTDSPGCQWFCIPCRCAWEEIDGYLGKVKQPACPECAIKDPLLSPLLPLRRHGQTYTCFICGRFFCNRGDSLQEVDSHELEKWK